MKGAKGPGDDHVDREYERLILLEELESLLEELEEQGISGMAANELIPDDLQNRMRKLDVVNIEQIRERIMHLHGAIDQDEDEHTISDS